MHAGYNYLTILIITPDKKQYLICENRPVYDLDQANLIYYYEQGNIREGTLSFSKKLKMVDSGTFIQRNYPPGIFCPHCKRNRVCK